MPGSGDPRPAPDEQRPRREQLLRALSPDEERFLTALERAGGEPVTLDELRDAGFARPAVLIYELSMAGCAVEQVRPSRAAGAAAACALAAVARRLPE